MSVNSDTKLTSEKLDPSSPGIFLQTMNHEDCSTDSTEDGPATGLAVCGIPDCEQQSANLSFPSIHVQMYYGLIGMDIGQVCPSCVSKADEFQQRSEIIRNGGSLEELKHEPELENLPNNHQQDSKDKTEDDDEEMDVNVAAVVDGVLQKLAKFVQKTEEDMVQLEGGFKEIDVEYGRIRGVADETMQKLNYHFNPKPEIIVTHEVDIPADGPITHRMLPSGSPDGKDTQMQVVTVQQLILPSSSTLKRKWNQSPTRSPTPKALTYNSTHEICFPIVGDVVYALNANLESCWLMATVFEAIENAETNEVEFLVEFEPTNKVSGKPVKPRCVMKAGALRLKRQLTTKQMAHSIPVPATHSVGTRVIADLRDELEIDPEDDGEYYVGVVGEIPKPSTKNRYLIFFDNGLTKYVTSQRVLLVYSSSTEVWNDVIPDSADFIQSYISNYPYWPLVRLPVGGLVSAKWNGKFGVARVLEVDCSLAKLQSEMDENKTEWVYRDSRRVHSIYKSNKKNDDPNQFVEYQGYIRKLEVPLDVPEPKKYENHKCNPLCAPLYFPTPVLKQISPLAIPLFLGWARNSNRAIFYIAPCGRKLSNYSEVNDYLETTETNMPIDFFCFDKDLDVLDEFVPGRILLKIENIAEGKEARPIQLVNSIDQDSLPCFEYIADAVGSPDVEVKMMLTFGKYSMSCTCTDNCKGKSSCACWNATTAGKPSGTLTPAKAYRNRRLQQAIIGGVYECSSVCSCKMTCHNRVVQCGITWPLQIFKTVKKGWALRALHDMPKGSFVCTYTGEVLSDKEADQISKIHGGFYMAALNHEEEADEKKKPSERKMMKLEPIDVPIPREEDAHVVDGCAKGNVGRFINHSCDPNLFMQNVFIDSHDPRFPHLAFFTTCLVKAGSELVFDYNYKQGSCPGTEMKCVCDSPYCRGRLL